VKNCLLAITILFMIIVSVNLAQAGDFQSTTSHYNQYSTDSINSPYSQQGAQYSASAVNNPYSQYEVQFSAKNVADPFAQAEHDYKANLVSPESQAKAKQARKKSAQKLAAAKFLEGKKTSKLPVFFFLLVTSSLALGATIFLIIGIFKK
jgi:hypothetical protein